MQAEERNEELVTEYIDQIKQLPFQLEQAILNLDITKLNSPYRPDGWTVHQLVHHVADSHMNAFIRFKLALTENNPTIKPYDENEWVKLEDVSLQPVNVSLTLLHALHRRWATLLKHINQEQWNKTLFHPEHNKSMTVWELLQMYAWHGKHHVAHITALRDREGWW